MPAADVGVVHHDAMSTPAEQGTRAATAADAPRLILLWALVFDADEDEDQDADEDVSEPATGWKKHAHEWFTRSVEDRTTACFPVIEVDGDVVATAIGTLELGVPNPQCPRGRTVRLANVLTVPEHRGKGFGTLLVRDVIEWARSIDADRVDLSATPEGQRIYEKVGFDLAKAPRMKLVLQRHAHSSDLSSRHRALGVPPPTRERGPTRSGA
jgi:GNAT superfamily N-acetyltransferase